MTGYPADPADYDAYNSSELAEIYDAVYADRDDRAFWAAMAPADGAILELACGTGRVLLPLARAGHEIVGLDLSAQMVERCRAHLADEPAAVRERVRLVQADMTSFELGRRFALVTSPFRGFQHVTSVERQLACLGRCHAHLASHGRLVLDLFNPTTACDGSPSGSPCGICSATSSSTCWHVPVLPSRRSTATTTVRPTATTRRS